MKPTILIPAYQPDEKLITLLKELSAHAFDQIVVVNDGSCAQCDILFEQAEKMGCTIVRHEKNRGKGRALKTGMQYCLDHTLCEGGVITADADGQHTPSDISLIAEAMIASPEALVLGVREFKGMPLKSKLGNTITRKVFHLTNGVDVRDTQTGLRGIPQQCVAPFVALAGELYEYEIKMLLFACRQHIPLVQIGIETIYIENNRSSHFHAFRDSFRIYFVMLSSVLLYSLSSITSAAVDYGMFYLMQQFVLPQFGIVGAAQLVLYSVVIARIISSIYNYFINCRVVFKNESAKLSTLLKYALLVGIVLFGAYELIRLFHEVLGLNVYLSKFIADNIMFILSFAVQRDYVFGNKPLFKKRKTV